MAFLIVVILLVSYLLGSVPSGLLVSKSQGIDIREHGSGNIGSTNVWRIMGKKFGLIVFIADTVKGWVAVVLALRMAAHWPVLEPGYAGITAALGCILGHNFPVWLRFKGGKGVATSLGVIVGMMPLASLIIFAVWGVVFKSSRYVSLASLVAAAALPVAVVLLMFFWPAHWWGGVQGWGYFYFACAAALLVIKRHTANIQRLVAGTENRFGTPKPGAEK